MSDRRRTDQDTAQRSMAREPEDSASRDDPEATESSAEGARGARRADESAGAARDEVGGAKRVVDITVPQVAGSALAAVIAALIAGQLGVYGTIIGAGVISVVATTGGPVFQHLFSRTGEGVREQVKLQGRQSGRAAGARPASARHEPARRASVNRSGAFPDGRGGLERTQLLPGPPDAYANQASPASTSEHPDQPYGTPHTHGTRWRGWRRALTPTVLVFVLAMGGVTLYEVFTGNNVSGGSGTSIGQMLGRDSDQSPDPSEDGDRPGPGDQSTEPGEREEDGPTDLREGDSPENAPTTDPEAERDGDAPGRTGEEPDDQGTTPTPTPTPAPTPDTDDGGADGGGQGDPSPPEGGLQDERQLPRTDIPPGAE